MAPKNNSLHTWGQNTFNKTNNGNEGVYNALVLNEINSNRTGFSNGTSHMGYTKNGPMMFNSSV